MVRHFCDLCGNETRIGYMRHGIEHCSTKWGIDRTQINFKTEIYIRKDGGTSGDICLECLKKLVQEAVDAQ